MNIYYNINLMLLCEYVFFVFHYKRALLRTLLQSHSWASVTSTEAAISCGLILADRTAALGLNWRTWDS